MRIVAAAFAGVGLVAALACSDPIDPSTATMDGTFVKIDSMVPGQLRLGVRSSFLSASRLAPGEYDFAVTLIGRILVQTPSGFHQIPLSELPRNSRVLVWTDFGDGYRMIPESIVAGRVVVPLP
jgi:hypothetical protein